MAVNKQEMVSVSEHLDKAYYGLASMLSAVNMASDVWEQLTAQQQRQYTRTFAASTAVIVAELRAARQVLTKK